MKPIQVLLAMILSHAIAGAQTSNDSNIYNLGTYTPIVGASSNSGGSGWNVDTDSISSFANYFNDSDNIRFDSVAITTPASGQVLALKNRAGNGDAVQQYEIRFFEAGSGYTTPVLTTNAFRYRKTGWEGTAYTYSPLSSAPAAGTYDVEIVNLSGGSHLEGLGLYSPLLNIGSGPALIQDSDLSYANGEKSFFGNDHPSGIGSFADNQIAGGGWFDYEVFNPAEAKTCILSVHARQNMWFPVNFNAGILDIDGDVPSTFASATVADTGWAGTEFFDYTSGTFTLPKGYSVIRITSDSAIHLDSFTITGASTPVPLAYSGLVIVPATPTQPADLTATVTGTPSATVLLQASTDLGQSNVWTTIHTFSLNSSGVAMVSSIPHTGVVGTNRDFFRFIYQ